MPWREDIKKCDRIVSFSILNSEADHEMYDLNEDDEDELFQKRMRFFGDVVTNSSWALTNVLYIHNAIFMSN